MFVGKNVDVKMAAIGQAIIQATRPRVILSPLQLGLGVQLHHHFASKFLIDTLHKHGFCCSYSEVKQFERSASIARADDIPHYFPGQFIQYVADNVDHNVSSLDGKDTFHGMGIIATVTPCARERKIEVQKASVSAEEIAAIGHVQIRHFTVVKYSMQSLCYEPLAKVDGNNDPTLNIDVLFKISLNVRSPWPAWSGMMQMVHRGSHPGKSSIMFLPMIDLNPSDMTCVLSTLNYISKHAKRYNVTPIITFNQPLWWKALTLIESQPSESELLLLLLLLFIRPQQT